MPHRYLSDSSELKAPGGILIEVVPGALNDLCGPLASVRGAVMPFIGKAERGAHKDVQRHVEPV